MKGSDPDFTRKIIKKSHTALSGCFNCGTCTSGCQFAHIMDFQPHQMIRLVQMGFKEDALSASAPWICVGCNTCSVNCPNAIDIPAVMDSLRQLSIEKNEKVAEPGIFAFHKSVLGSVRRYGRTHKLEIMMRYKMVQKDLFSDMDVGLKMFAKRKLDLLPSKITNLREVKKLFRKVG